MKSFRKNDTELIFRYEPELQSSAWVDDELKKEGSVAFRPAFVFEPQDEITVAPSSTDIWDLGDDRREFRLGVSDEEYFRIEARILRTKFDVFLLKDMDIDKSTFETIRRISIFKKLEYVVEGPIIIGGARHGAIPIEEFESLLKAFPNSTELDKYAQAKISRILADYANVKGEPERKFEQYLKRKKSFVVVDSKKDIIEFEIEKYRFIRNEIERLINKEETYSEREWQELIIQFILLIFPKYLYVLKEVNVSDSYSNPKKVVNRRIDLMLADADGNVDVIELKKPFASCLVSSGKYRDNYIPKRDLSGTLMQSEKYIFHLNKWGRKGEAEITKQQRKKQAIPEDFELRITNPKAIVIAGRSDNLNRDQRFDFEILKRKYSNVLDIMSYDDLLDRLSRLIEKFEKAKL